MFARNTTLGGGSRFWNSLLFFVEMFKPKSAIYQSIL